MIAARVGGPPLFLLGADQATRALLGEAICQEAARVDTRENIRVETILWSKISPGTVTGVVVERRLPLAK